MRIRLRTAIIGVALLALPLAALALQVRPRRHGGTQPGEKIVVEVLEALPWWPITGERIVEADGTIDLGCYGRVPIAGLRDEGIKRRIVLQLRRYLSDDQLGLVERDEHDAFVRRIEPADTYCVFVDLSTGCCCVECYGAIGPFAPCCPGGADR